MSSIKPRPWLRLCVACDEKIGNESAIFVENSIYHAKHFKCISCQQQIETNDQFHTLDAHRIVCLACYSTHFAPRCAACNVGIIDDCIRAANRHFHARCFVCRCCGEMLADKFILDSDGTFLDQDCYWHQRLLKFTAGSKQKIKE